MTIIGISIWYLLGSVFSYIDTKAFGEYMNNKYNSGYSFNFLMYTLGILGGPLTYINYLLWEKRYKEAKKSCTS